MNGARYNNPKVMDLLVKSRAEVDVQRRMDMYAQVQRIVMTELPFFPMYSNAAAWPGKQNVVGVQVNHMAQVNFFDVDIK